MTKDDLKVAMESLAKLGYLEDTGDRRPDAQGRMQIVYRLSALGHIAEHFVRQGLSPEAAMTKARTSN